MNSEAEETMYTLMLTAAGLSNLQKALEGNPDNPFAVKFLEELNWWIAGRRNDE